MWYEASQGIYGEITRDLYAAWSARLGEDAKIVPEEEIQHLFNDIGLFPSKSQIFEMVHCARAGALIKDRVDVKLQDDGDSDLEDYESNFSEILQEDMETDSHLESKKPTQCNIEPDQGKHITDSEQTEQVIHIHNYYLTLGEFCIFATELRRRYDQYDRSEQHMSNCLLYTSDAADE